MQLDDLDQVEGYLVRGDRKVDGRVYAHALSREIGSSDMCGDISAAKAEFDLDRRYNTFTVVVGLSDDASSSVSARFKIFGDGKLLKSATATLGKHVPLRVPVTGVLRLRIEANTNVCQYGHYGEIVWADPTLTP
jgi:hypothetical protein